MTKQSYLQAKLDEMEADTFNVQAMCLGQVRESLEYENKQINFKLLDGVLEINEAVDAG